MLHLGEDLRNRFHGRQRRRGTELVARGSVRERPFRPEVRHRELRLEGARRGDDLAEHGTHRVVGERSLVQRPQTVEDALLATRYPEPIGIAGAACRLAPADPLRDAGALVQEPHDALVDAVDLHALLIDVALHCCVARSPQRP